MAYVINALAAVLASQTSTTVGKFSTTSIGSTANPRAMKASELATKAITSQVSPRLRMAVALIEERRPTFPTINPAKTTAITPEASRCSAS